MLRTSLRVGLVRPLQRTRVGDRHLQRVVQLGLRRLGDEGHDIVPKYVGEVDGHLHGHALTADLENHVGGELCRDLGHALFIG